AVGAGCIQTQLLGTHARPAVALRNASVARSALVARPAAAIDAGFVAVLNAVVAGGLGARAVVADAAAAVTRNAAHAAWLTRPAVAAAVRIGLFAITYA